MAAGIIGWKVNFNIKSAGSFLNIVYGWGTDNGKKF
jgi:hypothetical protein